MVRRQLLCVVVPVQAQHALELERQLRDDVVRRSLDDLFKATKVTHFSCMALLPHAQPRFGDVPLPELMLEVAVDPGVEPEAVVGQVLDHGLELMWDLLGPACSADTQAGRKKALGELLMRCLTCADGGYVGCRDRTVEQIHAESKLFLRARQEARGFMHRAHRPPSSHDVADEIRNLARSGNDFAFTGTPSPRSFWRSLGMTPFKRYTLVAVTLVIPALLVFFTVMGALAVFGVLAVAAGLAVLGIPAAVNEIVFGQFAAWGWAAVASVLIALFVLETTAGLMRTRYLSVTASLMVVFGLSSLFVLGPLLRGGLPALWNYFSAVGLLSLWGLGVLVTLLVIGVVMRKLFELALIVSPAYLGFASLAIVFLALLGAAAWAEHVLFIELIRISQAGQWDFRPLVALARAQSRWGLLPADAVMVALLFFTFLGGWLVRRWWLMLPRFQSAVQSIDLPKLYDVPAVLQCDASIDACEAELRGRVNHMISITDIRDSTVWWRWMLRLFLRVITFLGESVFVEGRLGTAAGIHFGHWHIIDGGRRLLFCSNFDGGFGGYLDEFINGASQGINLFWRWTELHPRVPAVPGQPGVSRYRSFPPTRLLIFRGCKHEQWFKAYARDSMVPHLYRYEAYTMTNQDIDRATRLRDALSGPPTQVKDDQIMRALES